ncbi:hypothetical protein HRbin27_00922 [bacterium HR27]|nr:hypothetical protein HRbin27_00922 [bacterium HR27]
MLWIFYDAAAAFAAVARLERGTEQAVNESAGTAGEQDDPAGRAARRQDCDESGPGDHRERTGCGDSTRSAVRHTATGPERTRRPWTECPHFGRPRVGCSGGDRAEVRQGEPGRTPRRELNQSEQRGDPTVCCHLPCCASRVCRLMPIRACAELGAQAGECARRAEKADHRQRPGEPATGEDERAHCRTREGTAEVERTAPVAEVGDRCSEQSAGEQAEERASPMRAHRSGGAKRRISSSSRISKTKPASSATAGELISP